MEETKKKHNPKPKGGSPTVFRPTPKMIEEVQAKNAGKVELRVDHRTVILVDPDELARKGAQQLINEFNGIYFRQA